MEWSAFKLNEQGLLPVVTQDEASKRVLMVAYMDQAAYEETLKSGEMVYYSRSRQERWKKGETSGHTQRLKALSMDCDQDTLLAVVEQRGVACHTGAFTCFDSGSILQEPPTVSEGEPVLIALEKIIQKRKLENEDGSYTKYLFDKGLDKMLKKVGEEASEVIIAAKNNNREEVIYEVSDLMYHLMVTLNQQGLKWSDIEASLRDRFPSA
jgi:phosphoribosyl-ATP pyrophosphohydrolase/phosphoribosyl-AMP cyclohydrolase